MFALISLTSTYRRRGQTHPSKQNKLARFWSGALCWQGAYRRL